MVVNFDAFTYTGNLENLKDVKVHSNYRFAHGDLQKTMGISKDFSEQNIEVVTNLAAESHTDRNISGHADFIETNIKGIYNFLATAR